MKNKPLEKKLDEILAVLSRSPAASLYQNQKEVEKLYHSFEWNEKLEKQIQESINVGDKLLEMPMEFPQELDTMLPQLSSYFEENSTLITRNNEFCSKVSENAAEQKFILTLLLSQSSQEEIIQFCPRMSFVSNI